MSADQEATFGWDLTEQEPRTVTLAKEGQSSFTVRWVLRDLDGSFLIASGTTVAGGTRKSMRDYATERGWVVAA